MKGKGKSKKISYKQRQILRALTQGENIPTRELPFLVCLFTILGVGTSTQA